MRLRRRELGDTTEGSSSARERQKKQEPSNRQTSRPPLKPFRYLTIPREDLQHPYLVRERTRCGKPTCRCTRGMKHGPYLFLRYETWDEATETWRHRREYVPKGEVRRVRRWLRRRRAEECFDRGLLSLMRRSV